MPLRPSQVPPPGRCASRWLLFLNFYHLLPVVWYLAVAGGLAPASFLLAGGVASLFAGDSDGFAMAGLLLAPALVAGAVFYFAAWLLAVLVGRLRRPWSRTLALLAVLAACLSAALQPIFVSGGHGSSHTFSLLDFVSVLAGYGVPPAWSRGYFAALALVMLGLLAYQHLAVRHRAISQQLWLRRRRLRRRLLAAAVLLLLLGFVWVQRTLLIVKPLADFGFAAAQYQLAMTIKEQSIARNGRPGGGYQAWLERAAEQGHLQAAAELVRHPRNRQEKLRWLAIAAEGGMADAQYQFYRELTGRSPELTSASRSAADWLRLAAGGGQADAGFELGRHSLAGDAELGIAKDPDSARRWWEQAAAAGHGRAMDELAWRYASGADGFPWDTARAVDLYTRLAAGYRGGELGLPHSTALADDRQNRAEELTGLENRLAAADPQTQAQQGHALLRSFGATPETLARGVALLEQAAGRGDAELQHELGGIFLFGRHGQAVDLPRGRRWWDRALAQNHVPTMAAVAPAYQDGSFGYPVDLHKSKALVARLVEAYRDGHYGVAADPAKRRYWSDELGYFDRLFELAGGSYQAPAELQPKAEAGDPEAQYQLGRQLLVSGPAEQRRQGLVWIERAAEGGLAEAQYRLVTYYEAQVGIMRRDPERGVGLLRAAAEQNHLPAMGTLALGYEKGRYGLAVDLDQARQWYERLLQVHASGTYLGEINDQFIPFNRRRLAYANRTLESLAEQQRRYQQASPLERQIMDIEQRYRQAYQDAVNALDRRDGSPAGQQAIRDKIQQLREENHRQRDAEIAKLKAAAENPPPEPR